MGMYDFEDVQECKTVAEKALIKAKEAERKKIGSGQYEHIRLDAKTIVLRRKVK